jgi:ABC-2 type transport system permease protein
MSAAISHPANQRPGRPLVAVGNEVAKGLRHGWAERTQILIELPLFVSLMVLLGFTVGQAEAAADGRMQWTMTSEKASWLFLGMATYMFVHLQIQKMFWRMVAEIQTGTIEQTYLSPLPSWVHTIVGRAVSAVIEAGIVVAAMYVVTGLFVDLDLTWRLDVLIPLAFMLTGSIGFSLTIAGLTLIWKRIEMFNDLALLFVMFVSGVVIATNQLPPLLQNVSPFMFLTHPTDGIRTIMLDNQSLALWGHGGYVWIAAVTAGWLAVGVAIFRVCEHFAKRSGALGRY